MIDTKDGARGANFFRYLTYSDEDEKWQMVCTDAGYSEVQPYTLYPPEKDGHPRAFQYVAVGRTLNEYQIIYITKGQGIFQSQGKRYRVVPGSVFMVFPGVKHYYKPVYEIGWVEHWVGFKGRYFDLLVEKGLISPAHPFHEIGLQNNVLDTFSLIIDEVKNQKPLYQVKASARILSLISDVIAFERRKAQPNQSEQLVEQAKFLMEENIYDDIDLNSIAERLGVSTSRLNEVFKTYTSMTPYQYYIHIKMHMAKILLAEGDLSVKEVAFKLGFQDQYHFSRLFKSKTGIAPSQWKSFVYE
ncbi:MAG: AraC family transcriptional regulator [Spirochaetaceae bacterium]|nr:AraC family transcriptional regulator [Spirochaetaceae bacterium]